MFGGAEYSSASECCYADIINPTSRKKKSKKDDKRRFTDEQIRSLEVSFESETKLEPRKKAQLAKELGLHPRQVSIWFQNKRARWKSKQIEKDYNVLLADYNSLASELDCLNKENHSLLIQLQKMKTGTVGKSDDSLNHCEIQETARNRKSNASTSDGESDAYTKKTNIESNSISIEHLLAMVDERNDVELLKMVGAGVESPLTSSEDWGTNLESDDHHQWWDSWC